ncbi:MAG: hypothetical protein V7784_22995 [Oceanospirillaceae bacterium]
MIIIRKQLSWRDHHCFTAPLCIALDAKKCPVSDRNFAGFSIESDDLAHVEMSAIEDSTSHFCSAVAHSKQASFSRNARAHASDRQLKHTWCAATFLVFSILLLCSIFLNFQVSSAPVSTPIGHIVAFTNSAVVKIEF